METWAERRSGAEETPAEKKLINYTPIGETTDVKKFISNDGFFDISFEIKGNESLFFYRYRYFLEELTVSKLLQ
jgi:hypothetical protein